MADKNLNKSEVIRNILRDIGADKGQAPVNMIALVKSRLGKQGIKVTDPLIYQQRQRLLKDRAKTEAKQRLRQKAKSGSKTKEGNFFELFPSVVAAKQAEGAVKLAASLPKVRQVRCESVTVENLMAIKSLVTKLGGLPSFQKAFDAYQSIVGPSGPWPFPSS